MIDEQSAVTGRTDQLGDDVFAAESEGGSAGTVADFLCAGWLAAWLVSGNEQAVAIARLQCGEQAGSPRAL
ncbi:hypothetical protein D3C76_1789120 [compost metagenome]